MTYRLWVSLAALILSTSACAGSAPAAPTPGPGLSESRGVDGTVVSAVDGLPMGGVTVKIGNQAGTSDTGGNFHVNNVSAGSQAATLSGTTVVERHTTVSGDGGEPLRESMIPSSFDLVAFDQMFRGTSALQRWTSPPSLVVLTTVMNYEVGFGDGSEFHATSEQLTDDETSQLIDHLTGALMVLTGNTFTAFSSIERESAASGAKVTTLRTGKIVVGRYKGLQAAGNTIGYGRWATDGHSEVIGGAVYLDRDFDKTSDIRRLLRTHELGHALGYTHVTSRTSVMNPVIGPDVTTFDREGAMVAFQRNPGNLSPDSDPSGPKPSGNGGIFGVNPVPSRGPVTVIWSDPIF